MITMEPELDVTKLKYALYVRKSTDDGQRQVRSIEDQISECLNLAERIGLQVVNKNKPFIEKKSAKIPNKRPIFNELLKGLRSGKFEGILSWNPDRLARNMLEAGTLIDMVDNEIIKDLKFVTHYFTNDASGKMLLGISFVLSKEFSDKLSQDITRGVRGNLAEGKTATPKHGYINENGIFKPDGKNFELICEAWQLRLQGKSLETIANYLNDNNYGRRVKKDGRIIKMKVKILTDLFKDPFYMGILVQAHQQVDLKQFPGYNFRPAVTTEEYEKVQMLSIRRLTPYQTHKRYTFCPFKTIITCAFCKKNMIVGPSTGGAGGKILYYRCDNKQCEWKKNKEIVPRGLRGKLIMDFFYEFFSKHFKLTEVDYEQYYNKLDKLTEAHRVELQTRLRSLNGSLNGLERDVRERSLKIVDMNLQGSVKEANEAKIKEEQESIQELGQDIEKVKNKLTDPEKDRLTLEQFLNLSKNAENIVRKADSLKKDAIIRLIFLNVEFDNQKVTSYRLKPLFESMLKTRQIPFGGDGGN